MADMTSLRNRLRGMGLSSSNDTHKASRPAAGLDIRESSAKLDGRIRSLGADGMRRIGCPDPEADPERMLFLDTETTGLSGGVGTVAFLIGLGWIKGDRFFTRQILMKDYASETMLLDELDRACYGFDTVVTFNGNTFDLPLITTRCSMNRHGDPLGDMDRLDLLTPSRRLWKRRLGSVRLSRLEEEILGCSRENDLPGSEAPRRYFDYLKSGDMSLLEEVIEHNRQDIISLHTLLCALCLYYDTPSDLTENADRLSMGIALERQGEHNEAERLYARAEVRGPVTSIQAMRDRETNAAAACNLDRLLRRQGRHCERTEHLEAMCRAGIAGSYPYTELAKYYEHTAREPKNALKYARRALDIETDGEIRQSIEKRINRLRSRIAVMEEKK